MIRLPSSASATGAGLLVLGMLLVRRLLGRGNLLGQLRRRVTLVLEHGLFRGKVSDGLVELVGGGGTSLSATLEG